MPPNVLLLSDATVAGQEARHLLDGSCGPCRRVAIRTLDARSLSEADLVVVEVADLESALGLLELVRRRHPGLRVLALVAASVSKEGIKRIAARVDDFAVLPVRTEELTARVERLAASVGAGSSSRRDATRAQRSEAFGLRNLVGQDAAFRRLVRKLPRIAESEASVLVTGETGTGKELFARAIHHMSQRQAHPFVAVDCGAFPEQLLENELFGHVRGAFTDARSEQKGLARLAEGGVLFLDEIDSLSLSAQGKLLRFLQERMFKPLGAERFHSANVRIVAATNGSLPELVKQRRFRADLFFRLNILPLHLMPLRERAGDVPLLAERFLEECNREAAGAPKCLTEGAKRALTEYAWPGNVRELFNVVQRAVVLIEKREIDAGDLFYEQPEPRTAPPALLGRSFREAKALAVADFERRFVQVLLHRFQGNISRASREAGKDRRAFGRLVKKYSLGRATQYDAAPDSERGA